MPRGDGVNAESFNEAHRNVQAVVSAGRVGATQGLRLMGVEAQNTVRLLLTGPSPSAPGEPPGLDTGGLRLSYTYDVASLGDEDVLSIGSDASTRQPIKGDPVDYAGFQEEGTSKMPPRPHLRPAMAIIASLAGPMIGRSIVAAERVAAASLRGTSVG